MNAKSRIQIRLREKTGGCLEKRGERPSELAPQLKLGSAAGIEAKGKEKSKKSEN